jgi:hypothetical protein
VIELDVYRLVAGEIEASGGGEREDVWERLSHLVDPTQLRPKLADDIETRVFEQRWVGGLRDDREPARPPPLPTGQVRSGIARDDGWHAHGKEIVIERFEGSGGMELSTVIDLVRSLYRGNFLDAASRGRPRHGRARDGSGDRGAPKARQFGRTLSMSGRAPTGWVKWLYDHGLKWVFRPAVLVGLIAARRRRLGFFIDLVQHQRFVIAGRSLAIGFIVLIVLDYVMVFCHELGHALVHRPQRPTDPKAAGFQIYFGSPAFFVESSDG